VFAFVRSSCGKKQEYPEETNLSDLVTRLSNLVYINHIAYI